MQVNQEPIGVNLYSKRSAKLQSIHSFMPDLLENPIKFRSAIEEEKKWP